MPHDETAGQNQYKRQLIILRNVSKFNYQSIWERRYSHYFHKRS
jgi:hypothetical protein